jgi:hypothetical protein
MLLISLETVALLICLLVGGYCLGGLVRSTRRVRARTPRIDRPQSMRPDRRIWRRDVPDPMAQYSWRAPLGRAYRQRRPPGV